MPDEAEGREPVRLFNRTPARLVLEWGNGVIMPGESFLTDHPESYAPDQPGSPWTVDEEAAQEFVTRAYVPVITDPIVPRDTVLIISPDPASQPAEAGNTSGAPDGAITDDQSGGNA